MNQYTPMVLLPLRCKLWLLVGAAVVVLVALTLGVAWVIDWIIRTLRPL